MTALKSGHALLLTIPLPLYRLGEEIQETIWDWFHSLRLATMARI